MVASTRVAPAAVAAVVAPAVVVVIVDYLHLQ